jgi:predicted DNA-binding protein
MNKGDIMQKIRSTFTLSDYMVEELNTVAKELNQKKSHIIEDALNMYFDYMDLKVAEKRLNDKEDKVISADELFKELGV